MHRKPDVIRALLIVFTIGLLISGITSYASSDSNNPELSGVGYSSVLVPAEGIGSRLGSRH